MMAGAFARNDPPLGRFRQGFERGLPTSLARLEVKLALDHPGLARAQGGGALGQAQRGSPIAGAKSLIEKAAEPEKLRFGAIEHRREEFLGRRIVAAELGVLFQIVDDILDVTGTDADLGKPSGSDARHGKRTYVSEHGLSGARELASASYANVCRSLEAAAPDGAAELQDIADFIYTRTS